MDVRRKRSVSRSLNWEDSDSLSEGVGSVAAKFDANSKPSPAFRRFSLHSDPPTLRDNGALIDDTRGQGTSASTKSHPHTTEPAGELSERTLRETAASRSSLSGVSRTQKRLFDEEGEGVSPECVSQSMPEGAAGVGLMEVEEETEEEGCGKGKNLEDKGEELGEVNLGVRHHSVGVSEPLCHDAGRAILLDCGIDVPSPLATANPRTKIPARDKDGSNEASCADDVAQRSSLESKVQETNGRLKADWEQDPVFLGMQFAGCEHQYTASHFQRFHCFLGILVSTSST